jgi:hypothetical protein
MKSKKEDYVNKDDLKNQFNQSSFTTKNYKPEYPLEEILLKNFIKEFEYDFMDSHPSFGKNYYLVELNNIFERNTSIFNIYLDDLEDYFSSNQELVTKIKINTKR